MGKLSSVPRFWLNTLTWLGKGIAKLVGLIAAAAAMLWLVGFAMRQGWIPLAESGQSAATAQAQVERYICPMMCVPPTTEPGRCPVCGMELVAAAESGDGDGVSIQIEAVARRLIGVQTAEAKYESLTKTIRTIGAIEYDESKLSTISAYVDGRLEQMYADYVGVPVSQGDDLALIYSPELYSAQTEYLSAQGEASASRFINSSELKALAEEKLIELGLSDEQIRTLKEEQTPKPRLRIQSPQDGTVIEKLAVEGDYIKTGQAIYRVADLSTVWMMLDLFPDDAALVLFGQEVEAEISSAPGLVFTGRVAFVDPTVSRETRSVRVRVEMLNLDGKLRPGDYATARIKVPALPREVVYDPALAGKYISPMHPQVIRDAPGQCPICDMDLIPTSNLGFAAEPQPEEQVVTVPRDAVLMAGNDSVIYVETEPGRFEVRQVSIGGLTEERAIIAEGLEAGEVVATQGNFLLDSQSQLAGNPSLLDPRRAQRFPPGPLPNLPTEPLLQLSAEASLEFDRAFKAYFEIQEALARDEAAPAVSVNLLIEALSLCLQIDELPDDVQREMGTARRSAERLVGDIDLARPAFRTVSHAMIRSAYQVRGTSSSTSMIHYFCPMVPGGGGDWLQSQEPLRNPYWGAEMLSCGEMVKNLSLADDGEPPEETSDDPFAGMEVQELDL